MQSESSNRRPAHTLAFTRYSHSQYCMVYGIGLTQSKRISCRGQHTHTRTYLCMYIFNGRSHTASPRGSSGCREQGTTRQPAYALTLGLGPPFWGEHRPFEWAWRGVGLCSSCLWWWGRLCGGGVPLVAVPALSWCGKVSLGGKHIIIASLHTHTPTRARKYSMNGVIQ